MAGVGFEVGGMMGGLAMRVEGVVCTFGSAFSWVICWLMGFQTVWVICWLMDFQTVSCLFLATIHRQSSNTLLTRAINSVCEEFALHWLSLILRVEYIFFIVFYLTIVKPPLFSK